MRRTFVILGAPALICVALLLASCSSGGSGYSTPPPPPAGNGELASAQLTAGTGSYAHTFNTVGSFRYKCTIHPTCASLQGVVTVVGANVVIANDVQAISFTGGSSGGVYGAVCSMLSNQADSVHVGETVTWTNASPLPHTVTSY